MEVIKKKRGRKPKNFQNDDYTEEIIQMEKKKRGRKKKYEIENFEKILNRNEVNNFDHKVAYSDDENVEAEENCVKKISFGNLNITVSKKIPPPVETYKNYVKKELVINENEWESDEEKEIPIENILQENFEKYYKQNKKYIPGNVSDVVNKNEDSIKKMRVVTCIKNIHDLENTWPEKTSICCWWCCHQFTNSPCTLPVKYDPLRKRFTFAGVFCSWNCTKAYNLERNDYAMYNRSQLITLLVQQMHGICSAINIKTAPPRQCLKMFGGYMSIDEFRENKSVNTFSLNMKHHAFMYPEITEMSNVKIKTQQKNLRLSRNGC
jgi:hypothetical protein